MLGLGFAVLWGGYLIFNLGFYMVKGISVSITDLALPSHANAAHQLIGAGAGANPAAGPTRQPPGTITPGRCPPGTDPRKCFTYSNISPVSIGLAG